jgi:hypothetical protein
MCLARWACYVTSWHGWKWSFGRKKRGMTTSESRKKMR